MRFIKLAILTSLHISVVGCVAVQDAPTDTVNSTIKSEPTVKNGNQCISANKPLNKNIWQNRPKGYASSDQEIFFKKNSLKSGVVTLNSGVQYLELRKGCGKTVNSDSTVEVKYHGTLLNGKVFDSSYQRKETATFKINSVIKGWQEAVSLMPVGSIWEIYIPYQQAYGKKEVGPIPPYSPLIFTVELVSFK